MEFYGLNRSFSFPKYHDSQAFITCPLCFSLSSMPWLYFEVSIDSNGSVFKRFVKSSNFAKTLGKSIISISVRKFTQALLMCLSYTINIYPKRHINSFTPTTTLQQARVWWIFMYTSNLNSTHGCGWISVVAPKVTSQYVFVHVDVLLIGNSPNSMNGSIAPPNIFF